jgi:hypothetical protein
MRSLLSCSVVLVAASACGVDTPGAPDPAGDTTDADEMSAGYTRLIGRTWSIEPGNAAKYACVRFTVPEDMYISNIEARAPAGTHHTVLSLSGTNGTAGPDGEQDDCGVGSIGMVALYASGVGTSPLDFPEGVAIKVSAGQQLHLNLHLANTGDEPLAGETAILVKASATPPRQLAEMVFAGTYALQIPPTNAPVDVTGGCTATDDFSVFAVWPHMHTLGVHQKLHVIRDGRAQTLHDRPFVFTEQSYDVMAPIALVHTGDQIRVTCTYVNSTGATVGWGDDASSEMCFSGMYRYPAANAGAFACTDNPNQ